MSGAKFNPAAHPEQNTLADPNGDPAGSEQSSKMTAHVPWYAAVNAASGARSFKRGQPSAVAPFFAHEIYTR